MQSHMAILIAYCIGMKKTIKHCWILQFLLENGKKRTFSYKVTCKKFSWSGQKWRASHRAPLKYATGTVAQAYSVVQRCFRHSVVQKHATRNCWNYIPIITKVWVICIFCRWTNVSGSYIRYVLSSDQPNAKPECNMQDAAKRNRQK